MILLGLRKVNPYITGLLGGAMAYSFYMLLHNQMMIYVETNAFDGRGNSL